MIITKTKLSSRTYKFHKGIRILEQPRNIMWRNLLPKLVQLSLGKLCQRITNLEENNSYLRKKNYLVLPMYNNLLSRYSTSFNKSREHKKVSHKSRPAMQDMIPGLAPDPKTVLPFVSLGMDERLRRPIFDHILLGTLQACKSKLNWYHMDISRSFMEIE